MEIRLTNPRDPEFLALVGALDQEYIQRFGEIALKYQPYNSTSGLSAVCLAEVERQAAACGGIQPLESHTAELKRLYVRPEFRRKSLARRLVRELEQQARRQGFIRIALETGREMPEAISLYTSLGYRETEPWGPFVGDAICICMIKNLT